MADIPDLDAPDPKIEELLDMAQSIDRDEEITCTEFEIGFLETVLPILRAGRHISIKQEAVLRNMRAKYCE